MCILTVVVDTLSFLCIVCVSTSGDMSSSENLEQATVDERIQLIMDSQDPSIVDDLRHHNRGHPTKYDTFWEECKKYLDNVVETAVDDRRHG